MTEPKTYMASWRSEKAEERFRRIDAELWAEVETPLAEELTVETRFGPTHAYRWPGTGTPLAFLHGMGDTSRRWAPYASALPDRDIYAIDIMGEVGLSEQRVGFTSPQDYGPWLDDVLDGLELERPHLIGWSLGAYAALEHATQFPGRAASLLLFDPVGLADLRLARLMWWSAKVGLALLTPEPMRLPLADRLGQPVLKNKADMSLVGYSQRHHPPATPPIKPLTDDELQAIKAPVHVVAGANSQAFDTQTVAARVRAHLANGEIEVLDGAGHGLALTHLDHCLDRVRRLS